MADEDYGVRNKMVWFIGADNGSTGYEVVLQQERFRKQSQVVDPMPQYFTLFKIEPGGDATAIGMMVAELDMRGGFAGARAVHSELDPRKVIHNAAGPCEKEPYHYHRGAPDWKSCRCGDLVRGEPGVTHA